MLAPRFGSVAQGPPRLALVIAKAVQADEVAYGYASDVATGYTSAAQSISTESVDEAESSMDTADIAAGKLTDHIRTGDLNAPPSSVSARERTETGTPEAYLSPPGVPPCVADSLSLVVPFR
jgi:hypothetical protein